MLLAMDRSIVDRTGRTEPGKSERGYGLKQPRWQLTMKNRLMGPLALTLALGSGACALNYATDRQFQSWLSWAEARCGPRYGALPLNTLEQRAQFESLSYQTYYGDLPQEVYADRLRILYPDNGLTVDCLATSVPRL